MNLILKENNKFLYEIDSKELLLEEYKFVNEILKEKYRYLNNTFFILILGLSSVFVFFGNLIYKALNDTVSETIKLNDALLVLDFKLSLFFIGLFVLLILLIGLFFYNLICIKSLKEKKQTISKIYKSFYLKK